MSFQLSIMDEFQPHMPKYVTCHCAHIVTGQRFEGFCYTVTFFDVIAFT